MIIINLIACVFVCMYVNCMRMCVYVCVLLHEYVYVCVSDHEPSVKIIDFNCKL